MTVHRMPNKIVYASMADLQQRSRNTAKFDEVPGFNPGEVFRIQSLTAQELMEWTSGNERDMETAGLRMIILSLVGPPPANTKYAKLSDLDFFKGQSHEVTERLIRAILKLNGLATR